MKRWYADAFPNMAGSEAGEVIGRIDVGELCGVDSDNSRPQLVERFVERELAVGEAALEHGERSSAVGAREGAGLRHRDLFAGGGERGECLRLDARRVDREHDAELVRGRTQAGDEAGDRGARVGAVVRERERKLQPVRNLADREPLL